MHMLWLLVALVGIVSPALVMRGEAASPDVVFPLYTMRDVLGQAVTPPQGKEVGHIENVVLDAATGDLLYWVVTSGGVLGVGGTLRTLPWEVLQGAADRKAFQLQIEEEQFQKAPHFEKDRWPDMMDRHWIDAIHVYYGKTPRLGKHLGPDNAPVAQGPRPVLRAASVVQSTSPTWSWPLGTCHYGGRSGSPCRGKPSSSPRAWAPSSWRWTRRSWKRPRALSATVGPACAALWWRREVAEG